MQKGRLISIDLCEKVRRDLIKRLTSLNSFVEVKSGVSLPYFFFGRKVKKYLGIVVTIGLAVLLSVYKMSLHRSYNYSKLCDISTCI